MATYPEIDSLATLINQILDETAQERNYGLTLVRQILEQFPNNAFLVQFFAYLSSVLLYVETYKRQVDTILEQLSANDVTLTEIQEAGEDLGAILGRVLETKIRVERIINRLETLR